MNLCTSVFVYVGSIVFYKRIVNAHTQSIRIANADGQGKTPPSSKTVVFEDEGVQNISRIKNLPDTNNCFSTKHRQP